MTPRNSKINASEQNYLASGNEIYSREVKRFWNMVMGTLVHMNRMKECGIFNGTELNQCVYSLENISSDILKLQDKVSSNKSIQKEAFVSELQSINNDMASIFRSYGSGKLRDLVAICLGNIFVNNLENNEETSAKWGMLINSVYPIGYKAISWKNEPSFDSSLVLKKNYIVEDITIAENARNLECFDLRRTVKEFYKKVHGIKIALQSYSQRRTLIIYAIVDDVPISMVSQTVLSGISANLAAKASSNTNISQEDVKRFIECLSLKDMLIYSNDELWNRLVGYSTQARLLQQQPLSQIVKDFINSERYTQRTMLLQLLVKGDLQEYQYLAYLLFDLLSSDNANSIDTHEQRELFDSLPIKAKSYFKEALNNTVRYTDKLTNFDSTKIPLEQQICLMKSSDAVKERAMQKLKEVKNKNEDSGSKARQYLEGLLRIPFGVYKREPVLNIMDNTRCIFQELIKKAKDIEFKPLLDLVPYKDNYTGLEVRQFVSIFKPKIDSFINDSAKTIFFTYVQQNLNRSQLSGIIQLINAFMKSKPNLKHRKIPHSGKSIPQMEALIHNFINSNDCETIIDLVEYIGISKSGGRTFFNSIESSISEIDNNLNNIETFVKDISQTLTEAVHGHSKAKRQVERIIGQWVNGQQSGYCFGFEGPPGVGKTSLAKKGISNCLKDIDGTSRPFTFIAIGGGTNGSTLEGHNYTYVASTWGRIVDILMEQKCMNPIIFIDELDKVSKTEHGREIIGILTHLIDPTQNDTFQDKYFNGIDLDLSKALFIFSYNDVDAIDRILLDRIHRVKFDALTLEDKLVIANNYLVPEVLEKMGLKDVVDFSSEALTYLIEHYTYEPGVRKLKELMFEIVGEINLSGLRGEKSHSLPVSISIDEIKNNYLKHRDEVRPYKIQRSEAVVGVINGLYANALGKGGVLPIEVCSVPSSNLFDLKLTGMQGDVMKESMEVAKTLALKLSGNKAYEFSKNQINSLTKPGIHIHVPEGATKKDGPSAGTAITVATFSLLTNRPIRHDIAITGEICLSGYVTAIGGLEQKILGGIKAGVKTFLFPSENDKDFKKFNDSYNEKGVLDGIEFHQINNIQQAIELCVL